MSQVKCDSRPELAYGPLISHSGDINGLAV